MTKTKVVDLKLGEIKLDANIRTVTDNTADVELAKSIGQHGIIEPVIARKEGSKFILVSGYRRLAAAKSLKLPTIPVNVLDLDEEHAKEVQLVENIQRSALSPMDEAEAYRMLIDRGLRTDEVASMWQHIKTGMLPNDLFKAKVKLIAERTGKTVNTVTRSVRLLELDKKVLDLIRQGKLTITHGNLLLTLDREDRARCIKDHVNMKVHMLTEVDKHSYPVSDLEHWILSNTKRDLTNVPWDLNATGEQMKMDKSILSCTTCPSNTGNQGALFDGAMEGSCVTPACFNKKKNRGYSLQREAFSLKKPWMDLKFIGYGSSNNGIPDTIKKLGVVTEPSKQFLEAVKDKPTAFGWGVVKFPKKAVAVYLVIDSSILPKEARTKKKESHQDAFKPMDPKQQYISNWVTEDYPKRMDDILVTLTEKKLAEVLNAIGDRMYGWDDSVHHLFGDKAPKKLTVAQLLMVVTRVTMTEDSLEWKEVFTLLGADYKAIHKKLAEEAKKGWQEKLDKDAEEAKAKATPATDKGPDTQEA